jgi:NAD(P)-dependent dehydrogenase (short-subunit alcohol dehydrogenase family)
MAGLLDGKIALVTGAGHGIGRGHALELAALGATVIVNDLGSSVHGEGKGRDAEQVVTVITDRGGRAVADFGDVGDEEQATAMIDRAVSDFGRLDILVNNAGIVRDRTIWNMSVEDFDLVLRVHVRGSWLTARAAARHWREKAKASDTGKVYGRIINTTSGAGLLGNFGQSNYATAKAALIGLTLTLSLELGGIGVTVNAISPGGITRLSAGATKAGAPIEADERDPETFDPLDPSMSSPVVAWLASPEAGHVSGQVIRSVREELAVVGGWRVLHSVTSGGTRWEAAKLGDRFDKELFGTRAPGLQLGG